MKKINKTGAEEIIYSLQKHCVDLVFGYPGGAIMPTYDALQKEAGKIHHVLVRHEQGAVHAAQGYARASGKTGVCLATSGPGAINLITGIADAMCDSTPLVCITGQVSSSALGTDAFQEIDICSISAPITKWNYQIRNPAEIKPILDEAFSIAQHGRPGPVLVDITKDAQQAFINSEYVYRKTDLKRYGALDYSFIKEAAELINRAKRPIILIGQGVLLSRAERKLMSLANITQIPVASTLLGLSAFPSDHPLFKGMIGIHGNHAPNSLIQEADVILAVGLRFDDRVTGSLKGYAEQAKLIHIDIDPSEINRKIKATVPLIGDAKSILKLLLTEVKRNSHHAWHRRFNELYKKEYKTVIEKDICPQSTDLKMAEVITLLSKKTDGQANIVTDVGQHQMVTARYYQFRSKRSHITSGGLGTMGFALPAAIGAQLGSKRQVIAIMGDGGFQMCLQELALVTQEKIPLKMIILNNSCLGMVRQQQELFYENRETSTALENPDFISIALSYGIKGKSISNRRCLGDGLDEMLRTPGPFILEIVVEKKETVFPVTYPGDSAYEQQMEKRF